MSVAVRLRVTVMVILAILAVPSAVVAIRLGFNQCSVIDPFGLPWDVAPLIIVRLTCLAIVVASTSLIIVGFTRIDLRMTSIVLITFSAVAVIPGFLAVFILMFGDPDPTFCFVS